MMIVNKFPLTRSLVLLLLLLTVGVANADLQLLQPNPAIPATAVGNVSYSADALGQNGVGGTVQAEVPAGSTVVQAYLYGTYFFNADPVPPETDIDFDGTSVTLSEVSGSQPGPCCGLATARADVTAQVAAKVGGGGGITDFAVNTDPGSLDGVALVVIFSNPTLPTTTIAVLDGSAQQAGDTATFTFAEPLDTTIPGFSAIMSLGSGFSFQGSEFPATHFCGVGSLQSSLVDVNGTRLTSCAGHYDDGVANDGALITTGGVGDDTNNPDFPLQEPADGSLPRGEDDELYDLEPFLSQGDPAIVIETSNPSGDDNLFLVVIEITAEAAVTTEICDDGIDNDGDGLVDAEDPDCAPPGVTCNGLPATIEGTNASETIIGTAGPDVIHGLGGNDLIRGLAGEDVICGGSGKDRLFGNQNKDKLFGQGGDDAMNGGGASDFCSGGSGTDTAVNCESTTGVP